MKKIIIHICLLGFNYLAIAQPMVPAKLWDRTIGGSQGDEPAWLSETKDRGLIIGGSSASPVSGDKTQPNWDTTNMSGDYWIIKTDSNGNKQWDKRYGGTNDEYLSTIQQTTDGGYILGGSSYSGISGDKTQANWGDLDFWVVKVDSIGNKQWDRRYGGYSLDILLSMQQTKDGGYILGGITNSPISGDISEPNRGTTGLSDDYWVIKIDSAGNKQWDKRFGTPSEDDLAFLQQTKDGGYILGGYTDGDSIDDKTQPTYGLEDYWIVKIDSAGHKQWDGDYGGDYDDLFGALSQTTDGGYILAGTTYSDGGGDKTTGKMGYWIVKIDSTGHKLWDKADSTGFLMSVFVCSDGGFLMGGVTSAGITADKSQANLGATQVWLVRTDSVGNKVWDRTILTYDSLLSYSTAILGGYAIQLRDGDYVMTTPSNAGIGGDKTDTCKGYFDYFTVKLSDSLVRNVGIADITPCGASISVYPNPFIRDVSITIQGDGVKEAVFTLYNASGQQIYYSSETHLSASYTKTLDLTALPQGIYQIAIVVDEERIIKGIVKE